VKPYTIEVQRLKSIRHDHHGLIEVSLDALVSARQAARDDSEPGVPSSCLSIPVEHARTLVLLLKQQLNELDKLNPRSRRSGRA
jgi:hypothetical protein